MSAVDTSFLHQEQAASHMEGWVHYFDRLADAVDHDDAGADEWWFVPTPLTDCACAVRTPLAAACIVEAETAERLPSEPSCARTQPPALAARAFFTCAAGASAKT